MIVYYSFIFKRETTLFGRRKRYTSLNNIHNLYIYYNLARLLVLWYLSLLHVMCSIGQSSLIHLCSILLCLILVWYFILQIIIFVIISAGGKLIVSFYINYADIETNEAHWWYVPLPTGDLCTTNQHQWIV